MTTSLKGNYGLMYSSENDGTGAVVDVVDSKAVRIGLDWRCGVASLQHFSLPKLKLDQTP